jgi:hypothetical protein
MGGRKLSVTKNCNRKIEKLEYTNLWIKYGFLSENILNQQYNEYLYSNDKNTEHYRYQTLQTWLKTKKDISNEDFSNFLKIYEQEKDKLMIDSFLITLIKHGYLTQVQLQKLSSDFSEKIQNEVHKFVLLEKLNQGIDNNIFYEILETKNNILILALIERLTETKKLQYIIDNNIGTKKIKNIVKQKLKKRVL